MKGLRALERFLSTDPRDAGCAATMDELHVYAEALLRDPAGARGRYPGIAAHIESCGPCAEDLAGLLAALHADDTV
jgi:hypothetical protein